MSTKTKLFSASLILAASLMTAGGAQALGPQDNRCWGEAAASLAQGGPDGTGGTMGDHSKASQSPQTTFRDSVFGGTGKRTGIGNGTSDPEGPHATDMKDGGLAVHAKNNSDFFTDLVDPWTGEVFENPDIGSTDNDLLDPESPCSSVTTNLTPVFGGTSNP
jgi:hypothetical protein